jgi:hypothetical protein
MLFKVLKLFGLDVRAEVAAVKNQIEQRVEDIADRAKHAALSAALIIALSTFAGLFFTMAIGVGLIALYHTEAAAYGVGAALAIDATALVAAALILIIVACLLGKSLSSKGAPEFPDDVARPAVVPAAPLARVSSPAVFESEPADSAGDLIEPLAFLLGKYVRYPALGHPVLDDLIGKLRVSARGPADEAVERAANLMCHGDRSQLLVLPGGAVVAGWLLARQSSDERLHDVAPAD